MKKSAKCASLEPKIIVLANQSLFRSVSCGALVRFLQVSRRRMWYIRPDCGVALWDRLVFLQMWRAVWGQFSGRKQAINTQREQTEAQTKSTGRETQPACEHLQRHSVKALRPDMLHCLTLVGSYSSSVSAWKIHWVQCHTLHLLHYLHSADAILFSLSYFLALNKHRIAVCVESI